MNSDFEDLKSLLTLSRTPGVRMAAVREFFEAGKEAPEVLDEVRSGGNRRLRESLEETERNFSPERELERAEKLGLEILGLGDPRYPFLLRESSDPPFVLYFKGDFLETDQAALAIVGSRHPSFYGLEQAKRFSEKLSRWGITIISGFARGIDRSAHEGALAVSYGRTMAVLGSGLDVIYPMENRRLYDEIAERGAVITEFALGTPPLAENFPKRNRIIAGLSLGTVVIEAHSRSGSLITAHLAADEGREVFALPGRVDQLGSRGTHRLIKEGALLVESPEEVLEAICPQLFPLAGKREEEALSEEESGLLSLFGDGGRLTLDEITRRTLSLKGSAAALVTRLELKGRLRRRPDGRYEKLAKGAVASYT